MRCEASRPDSVVTVCLEALADTIGVQVIDQGCGMTRQQVDRILDPFYTTRQHEGGTGLGLSITYGIIQQHGGTIDVKTSPGRGTTMSIRLPVAAAKTGRETGVGWDKAALAAAGPPAVASGQWSVMKDKG